MCLSTFATKKNINLMKKVLFSLALLVAGSAAFAQVNKGQWLVGGNVGFNTEKRADANNDFRETSFNVSPNAGYFFADRIAGGLRINLESSKVKGAEDGFTIFTAAPFVRYYFLPAIQKVNVLADASYGFGSLSNGKRGSVNEFNIAAGPAVFLTPNTALEFTLAYNSKGGEYFEVANDVKRLNAIRFNVGFQIHLGNAATAAKK
jgi:hypothetical protein